MYAQIIDSDIVVLNSVDSYMNQLSPRGSVSPQEQLIVRDKSRDVLYSDIVQRLPRIATYILMSDLDNDKVASGLYISLSGHCMDPAFVTILMQYLGRMNDRGANGIVGALLAKIASDYLENNSPKKSTAKDKSEKKEELASQLSQQQVEDAVKHIFDAVEQLLGAMADILQRRCGNITHNQALSMAACVSMNSKETFEEIIAADMPVTAQALFDIVEDPSALICAALNLEKSVEPAKTTPNQAAFIDSLKRWVYDKLNQLSSQVCYTMLVSMYGTVKPAVSSKLIQIKDCGTQYSNLLQVARTLIN